MSVGFTVPTGIACDDCTATEQDCARNYPCCTECSHFADPEQPLDLTPDRPPRRPEQPMTTPTPLTRDTLADLLARARPLTDTKIRRAVERVDQAHDQLRAALADHTVRDAARRDVERLERQLAEARKKLRGGARPVAASAHGTPCGKGCGRTFTSTGWRTKHEADCTGAAA